MFRCSVSRLSDNRCALRKGTSWQFPRNVVKLLTFNGDCGFKQKAANRSKKGAGGRQDPDQTKKKKTSLDIRVKLKTTSNLNLTSNYPLEILKFPTSG